ncbi:MAG TPA: hypothetical protein PK082_06935 [Phycisphaerae bacterium]|nr:hypothetical protein [Phycisphaerae bacterium]
MTEMLILPPFSAAASSVRDEVRNVCEAKRVLSPIRRPCQSRRTDESVSRVRQIGFLAGESKTPHGKNGIEFLAIVLSMLTQFYFGEEKADPISLLTKCISLFTMCF